MSEFVKKFKNAKKKTSFDSPKKLNLERLISQKDCHPPPSFYHPHPEFKRVKEVDRAHHQTHSGMLGVTRPRSQQLSIVG